MLIDVYKLTNKVTGRGYIGISCKGVRGRWLEHVSSSRQNKNQQAIVRAIRKHGPEMFELTVLRVVRNWDKAHRLEQYYIRTHNCRAPNGYNLTNGGEGTTGLKHSLASRRQMSESHKGQLRPAQKGRPLPEATKAKISASVKQYLLEHPLPPKSQATRAALSRAGKGKKCHPKTSAAVSAANKRRVGMKYKRHISPDLLHEKLSRALTGRIQSRESVEKRRAANKGKRRSPEFCARASQNALSQWAKFRASIQDPDSVLSSRARREHAS